MNVTPVWRARVAGGKLQAAPHPAAGGGLSDVEKRHGAGFLRKAGLRSTFRTSRRGGSRRALAVHVSVMGTGL